MPRTTKTTTKTNSFTRVERIVALSDQIEELKRQLCVLRYDDGIDYKTKSELMAKKQDDLLHAEHVVCVLLREEIHKNRKKND